MSRPRPRPASAPHHRKRRRRRDARDWGGLAVLVVLFIYAWWTSRDAPPAPLPAPPASEAPAERWRGVVEEVPDGDTVVVTRRGGERVRCRLHGVDAPEGDQPYGREARQVLRGLVDGREVGVEVAYYDQHGRAVVDLSLPDGRDLGQVLVGAGAAWWYEYYVPDDQVLAGLEAEARAAKRGLWAGGGSPEPPWDYRQRRPRRD